MKDTQAKDEARSISDKNSKENDVSSNIWVQIGMFFLILSCGSGNNFGASQDTVSETPLESHYNISNSYFNQIFVFKIWGVLLSGIFGIYMLQKLGFYKSFLISILFSVLGQLLCCWAIYYKIFTLHLIGRFWSGAAEIISSFNITLFNRWYRPEQVIIVYGFGYWYSRFVISLWTYFGPILISEYQLIAPYLVWLWLCLLGMGCAYLVLHLSCKFNIVIDIYVMLCYVIGLSLGCFGLNFVCWLCAIF